MNRYAADDLRRFAAELGVHYGVPEADAELLADSLMEAELTGAGTHGMTRLKRYIERIQGGYIDPMSPSRVERESVSTAAIDGGNGLGQVLGVRAMRLAVGKARETGVGVVTVRRSAHWGANAYYCRLAAAEQMIGIAYTNCEPAMPPTGGRQAFFGTNPIALACPTGKGWPIQIDLATSGVARGKIVAAAKAGEPIPVGWAIDADGNPTTDAQAALDGAVLTMAGHKGYALAMMVEILSAVLSGSAVGPEVASMIANEPRPADVGHFTMALAVEAFMPVEAFTTRIDAMIDAVTASPPAPGAESIRVPGEAKHACNCCSCSCWSLGHLSRRRIPRDILMACHFIRSTDEDSCAGCGDCIEACPMDVIELADDSKPKVDMEWCIGCGVCSLACPSDAIAMMRREDIPDPFATFEDLHAARLAEKARES